MKKFTPIISLVLICIITAFMLATVNYYTANKIAEQVRIREENLRKNVIPQAEIFRESEGAAGYFGYEALDVQGNIIGYVIVTSVKGYGDDITVMTGIGLGGEISGVQIVDCSETPGLGMKCKEPWFTKSFVTSDKVSSLSISDIDVITGATVTTNAVLSAVNEALAIYANNFAGQSSQGGVG